MGVQPLPLPEVQQGVFRCFQVTGEGMTPTVQALDWVIARYSDPMEAVEEGGLYVVVTTTALYLSRVVGQQAQETVLLLKPDGASQQATAVARRDVVELWQVRGQLSFQRPLAAAATEPQVDSLERRYHDLLARVQRLEQGR